MWRTRTAQLTATLWAGSLWTVGYLVAPVLFATLDDRALAGSIAGSMFRAEAVLTMVCSLVLLCLMRSRVYLVIAMSACTWIGYFALHPYLVDAKAAGNTSLFGILHGVSSVIYLAQSLMAVALVGWVPKEPRP
jgi:hypothetical protein